MELENSQNNSLAKLPILKLGEYEMWEIRIKIYFHIQTTLLWEVIRIWEFFGSIPIYSTESVPPTALKGLDLNVSFVKLTLFSMDTHVAVWMNKPDFETMGLDDLYNNFKIVEQKVKRTVAANNDDKNLAFLTTTSTSSTNSINTGSQLVHEDLEQIHDDDLEEMDLKWNMALLSMRARKFYQRTGRKIIIDGNSTAGYDKSKIALLKRSVGHKDYLMGLVKTELEKVKEEKEGVEFKLAKFEKSSKDLDDLLASQSDEEEVESTPNVEKKNTYCYKEASVNQCQNQEKNSLYAEMYRSQRPRGNHKEVGMVENSDQLGCNFLNEKWPESCPKIAIPLQLLVRSVNTARPVSTARQTVNTVRPHVNTVRARGFNAVKPSACWVWRPIKPNGASLSNSQLNEKGFVDSGCSRHMSGNIAHLSDFKEFDGGYVTFGGGANGGRITGKGTIKTDKLDFEDVYFVKELKFNLFSVSQMCDKKNYVLFTDSECLVLSPNFKLAMMKATSEESMLWHRRLGHVNFKNINKLVKENLVRDLPLKRFENDQTCVACLKGKQHRASYKLGKFDGKCVEGSSSMFLQVTKSFCVKHTTSTRSRLYYHANWKDASYFEDTSLKSVADAQIQDQDSTVNTGSGALVTVTPEVNTATSEGLMGPIPTTEDTQAEDQSIDLGNLSPSYAVSSTPHTRIHKDHPIDMIFLVPFYDRKTHQDLHTCLFACFLSQEEPKRVSKALSDPAWVEAMQEELLQFKLQNVWVLVDLPKGHRAIGTKWVYRNKKDERGIVVRNKARLVAQGHTQEEGIDYDEVGGGMYVNLPVLKILTHPDKVYKVVKALYGNSSSTRACQKGQHMRVPKIYVDDIILDQPRRSFDEEFEEKNTYADDVMNIYIDPMIGSLIYLKGKPSLGLWYSKDSPLELVDFLAMKETKYGAHFYKTEAENVAAVQFAVESSLDPKHLLDMDPAISLVYDVSTAAATLVYIRRSASKTKDKGKAIMQESEPTKKLKKRVQV
ncbi:putative ribonuclease H-like domain-containing protein [Tanacetum coccineum]|uniref:Ribonuclease H-like domain-containing protein n=1 Tax=Tanacetum coccineum TaxID=301880 RepID=A0ABQ4YQM5_9ASTR